MEKKEQAQMSDLMTYFHASRQLTPAEKVGQLFMPAVFINDTEEEIIKIETLIMQHHVGGLCFFHSRASAATNYEGEENKVIFNEESLSILKKLVKRYQGVSKYPLLIGIDAEWGLAMRIENTPQYPYAITLGAIQGHDDLIFEVGKNIAFDCKQAGIHWNLSPVADINNNPNNPVIGYRSFGEDKFKVAKKAIAFVEGTKSEGVLSSVKHFPGHGDTATDSHLGLPVIEKPKSVLMDNELYPFKQLIKNDIDAVMVGHLVVPALTHGKQISASISKDIIKGVLRKELNFKGTVISDALNMHSVSKLFSTKGELEWLAFDAGNDVLCFAENVPEGIEIILHNASELQIEESFERVWKLKEKAIKSIISDNGEPINPDSLNRKLASESLTSFKDGSNTIADFIEDGFVGISVGKGIQNDFFVTLSKKLDFESYSTKSNTIETIQEHIKDHKNILLSLFPPNIKPMDNFGIIDEEFEFIKELIQTKNVVLYVFGNPYVLNNLDIEKIKTIMLAYQNFEVFQQNSALHFLGRVSAKGKVPVTITQVSV